MKSISEAIILAGGRGERLRPLTDDRPKPMVLVDGQPLLHYTISWLKEFGIERIVLSCGYLHHVISDYFGDGRSVGVQIEYSIEDQPLGRGGGIKLASNELTDKQSPVLVMNGDVVTNLSLSNLFEQHVEAAKPVTVVTTPLRCSYGIIDSDEQGVATCFREKPILPYWINAGIYLIDGAVFKQFPDRGDHEEVLFPNLCRDGQIKTFKYEGFWSAIDTRKDLEELKKERGVISQLQRLLQKACVA